MLPVSSAGEPPGFIDALFTATSAVCVTGLTVRETGTFFSPFGRWVILGLIQLGALGYMSLASIIVMLMRKGMSIKGRILVQQHISGSRSTKLSTFILRVVSFTLVIEAAGAVFLAWRMRNMCEDLSKAVYFGVFHSVSAFCNAGFDVFALAGGESLTPVRNDMPSVLIFSFLIISGGIGFIVLNDLYEYLKKRFTGRRHRFSLHTRIVARVTLILLVAGTVVYFFAERSNPETLGGMSLSLKWLNSFFMAVTPRTAGFNMVDTAALINFSIIFTIILMFIGASPGGTGGGIKTTTLAVLLGNIKSIIREEEDVSMFRRRITPATIRNSVAIFTLSISFVVLVTLLITATESFEISRILFEVTSAFGTVGLSTGITGELSGPGRILITLTMFFGRLGPVTVGAAILTGKKRVGYRYPEQEIAVG